MSYGSKCPKCDDTFDTERGMKNHHKLVHDESLETRVELECERCGDGFKVKPYRADSAKYCGHGCANVDNGSSRNPEKWDTFECEWCGDEYEEKKYRADRTRFCSASCRSEWTAEDVGLGTDGVTPRPERNPEKWDTFECEWCGDEYEEKTCRADRTRFCSVDCRIEGAVECRSGENSNFWKDGNPTEWPRGPNWTAQSRRARKRDDYTCQRCGLDQDDHYRKLDVHHKTPFKEFDDPVEANKLDNLTTLCPQCHFDVEYNRGES